MTKNIGQAQVSNILKFLDGYSQENEKEDDENIHLLEDYAKLDQKNAMDNLTLVNEISEIVDKSARKEPYQINLFDYIGGIEEPSTSFFLKEILNYCDEGNYNIARSFAS